MARILIIGIGNTLRSDDGVGWHIAQEFRERLAASDSEAIAVQQLMPEIAETISRVELVLFVDAMDGGKPGRVQIQPIVVSDESRGESHHLTPEIVLGLTQRLYQRCPRAFQLTIAGESFNPGETFSAAVSDALPAVRTAIDRFLAWARKGDCTQEEFLDGVLD
jgi:hydrogenase maturation protease